jgi:hypothetical protein
MMDDDDDEHRFERMGRSDGRPPDEAKMSKKKRRSGGSRDLRKIVVRRLRSNTGGLLRSDCLHGNWLVAEYADAEV